MTSHKNDLEYAVERLINYGQAAEGSSLPPVNRGGTRVPAVRGLTARFVGVRDAFNEYIVQWMDPETDRSRISHFEVWVTMQNQTTVPQGPFVAYQSPAFVILPRTFAPRPFIVFHVLTVMKNGPVMSFELAPTTTERVLSSAPPGTVVDPGGSVPDDPNKPIIVKFKPSATTVNFGQNVFIDYNVQNASSANINSNPIELPSGSYWTQMLNTTVFTLTAYNGAVSSTATTTVYVQDSRITMLNASVLRYISTPPSW